ncbi:MAG: addiction module protein [Pseudomonadales bacterium]|nr:addiction module protein [Pseudomonadales bacterium]
MAISAELIETEALSLSREEKARLVLHLLESIEERAELDPRQMERAWLTEANRRYQSYLRGEEQAISAEEVFAELRADDR